jgi:polyphosphate kinase
VTIKANSVVDEAIIDALYRASMVGLPIDVWTRGICAIRPGVPDLSSTIRVRSVLGRFLEHSRIYAFVNGGDPEVWIGSADLMHRNLDRRVEVLVRLTSPDHITELIQLTQTAFSDQISAWRLGPTGEWTRHNVDDEGRPLTDLQDHLIRVKSRRRADSA